MWSDDIARSLLLALSFLGAAAALARGENAGVTFFVDRLPPGRRVMLDAMVDAVVLLVAGALCWHSWQLLAGHRRADGGRGHPAGDVLHPALLLAAAAMALFAADKLCTRPPLRAAAAVVLLASFGAIGWAWTGYSAGHRAGYARG